MKIFCTRAGLFIFKTTLSLAKLHLVCSRLISNGLVFLYDILVDILWITVLLLFNIWKVSIGAKIKKFWQPSSPTKYVDNCKKKKKQRKI